MPSAAAGSTLPGRYGRIVSENLRRTHFRPAAPPGRGWPRLPGRDGSVEQLPRRRDHGVSRLRHAGLSRAAIHRAAELGRRPVRLLERKETAMTAQTEDIVRERATATKHLTHADRVAQGKDARGQAPLEAHAEFTPEDSRDPVGLLMEQG